ncbi:hypothetical protein [Rhizobium leguminosarum]|uniref:hypothetical protein n=1 Tax=Rhizobium leguminosarum TaxID=384 RepID=UPI0011840293|nr:hypothetical protein [Rhizobium leguminosarum]
MTGALLLFVFVFTMHSETQNSDFTLVIKLPIEFKASENISHVGYALHGLRMIGLLFWVIPFLAWIHAKGESGSAASAFPLRLLDIQPASVPGVVVQTIAFLLLIVAPLVSAVHFWQIVEEEGKVCQPDPTIACEGIWSRPVERARFWDHTYRLTDGTTNRGPSYEPFVEPILTLALLAVALGFVILLLREMYRAQKSLKSDLPLIKGECSVYRMLKQPAIVIGLIILITISALIVLCIAHGNIASESNKEAPKVLFWMEVSKQVLQMLSVALVGSIIAGFLKLLFDGIQTRRQVEAARDQFRKDVIAGFIDARYEATARREQFLNSPSGKLGVLYPKVMEDFVVIKEKLSRVWHDVETGKQSLSYAAGVQDNVVEMKKFFEDMLKEYRSIKDQPLPNSLDYFLKLRTFGDFLSEGDRFTSFIERYRRTLGLIRLDLLGNEQLGQRSKP